MTRPTPNSKKNFYLAGLAFLAIAAFAQPAAAGSSAPAILAETGLYADFPSRTLAERVYSYSPQYPLWTDGAAKSRWIYLPPGKAIGAASPDAWVFPVGTKLWKEFSWGREVETRYMERVADGSWIYATYHWNEDGTAALLAPERGLRNAAEIRPGVFTDLPGRWDCVACHEGKRSPVLGFTALQLSPDRDPLAPHAEPTRPGDLDLPALVKKRFVSGLPKELLKRPPRILAPTPVERAALGYMVGNCSHCHNPTGPLADLGFSLAERATGAKGVHGVLATAVGAASQFQPERQTAYPRIAVGAPESSVLIYRVGSRQPMSQMPPLGTKLIDEEGLALLSRWITELAAPPAATLASANPL